MGKLTLGLGKLTLGLGKLTLGWRKLTFALGKLTLARGKLTLALGKLTLALGKLALALGKLTLAEGKPPPDKVEPPPVKSKSISHEVIRHFDVGREAKSPCRSSECWFRHLRTKWISEIPLWQCRAGSSAHGVRVNFGRPVLHRLPLRRSQRSHWDQPVPYGIRYHHPERGTGNTDAAEHQSLHLGVETGTSQLQCDGG